VPVQYRFCKQLQAGPIARTENLCVVWSFYARLVRGSHESAGKKKGSPGNKIGNAHLKWAFGEAACLLVRHCERGKVWLQRKEKKCGKAKALAILAAKIGRTVYHLWRKREVFDGARVFGG